MSADFHFRQFSVQQSRSAQKVCTDSCLFGAWVAALGPVPGLLPVLDVGAGTGLLSLMLAQEWPGVRIEALEPDAGSAEDARANFRNSPWPERLQLHPVAYQDFRSGPAFGQVISNPPFFIGHLPAAGRAASLARHMAYPDWVQWIRACRRLVAPGGRLALLMTGQAWSLSKELIRQEGLVVRHGLQADQARVPGWRVMVSLEAGAEAGAGKWESLSLYTKPGVLNARVREWLVPFYQDRALDLLS